MSSPQQAIAAPAEIQQAASAYLLGAIRQVDGPNMGLVRGNKTGAGMAAPSCSITSSVALKHTPVGLASGSKERLLPQTLQAYAQGQTLTFGSLAFNQQGVKQDQQLLHWNQIEAIVIQIDYNQEVVCVKRRGERRNCAKVTTSTIPTWPSLFVGLSAHSAAGRR